MRPRPATIKFMTAVGHDPDWSALAASLRAHRLLVYRKVWAKLSVRDQWVANSHFLDGVLQAWWSHRVGDTTPAYKSWEFLLPRTRLRCSQGTASRLAGRYDHVMR